LLAITFVERFAVAFVAAEMVLNSMLDSPLHRTLNDRRAFRSELLSALFLLPLRDLIAPFVWAASFMGNRIHWRGDVFDLKDGRLTRTSTEPD